MRIIKSLVLPFVLLVVVFFASACGSPTPVQPVATTVPPVPACSVIVASGMGMSEILGKLGMDYNVDDPILLIDGARGTKAHTPQPSEVISLESPASNCTGESILARQLHFSLMGHQSFEISGFQSTVTTDRVMQALSHTCELTRWFKYGLRFDGDIVNGGCGYATAVLTSFSDGSSSCTTYASFSEAYDATVALDLANLKWLAITSEGTIVDSSTTVPNYCSSTNP